MPFVMHVYTDGGCRRNGKPWAIGAAAVAFKNRRGKFEGDSTQALPSSPTPTSQRAEISGIILALEKVLQKHDTLVYGPLIEVTIHSDSRYAIDCMTKYIHKWTSNGWVNSAGNPVANQDLIQEAAQLEDRVRDLGSLTYKFIPREENSYVDGLCNQCLDDQE
ncbi:ribonuclease H-like domain-containing protein [Aspergillus californicus]